MKRLWPAVITAAVLVAASFAAIYILGGHPGGERSGLGSRATWQRMTSPGVLSAAHAFLEHDCNACHAPYAVAESTGCITCHANETALLGRQPTAFHAAATECSPCHREHQGFRVTPTEMEHTALAAIARNQAQTSDPAAAERRMPLIDEATPVRTVADLAPAEAVLDCAACHGREDRHFGFFGQDCAACHDIESWAIPSFRHPPPASTECNECHKAPPSHFMGHFRMVSARIARQGHAGVEQCHVCHQTTSWNDIRGIGWYKHH